MLGGDVEYNPGPTNQRKRKQAQKQQYLLRKDEILAKKRLQYAEEPERKREISKAEYSAAPQRKRAASQANYAANPEPKRAASLARYAANPEPKRAASLARYAANPEPGRAASLARYAANPEPKRAASLARYVANPEPGRAASLARYAANPEPKRAASLARYAANPEPQRAAFRVKYAANPELKRAASLARYAANPEPQRAASRAKYAANPQPKKAASRMRFQTHPHVVRAAVKAYYEHRKGTVNHYRRGKYNLKEPKAHLKAHVAKKLQQMLFALPRLRLPLRISFKQSHESLAKGMSKTQLNKSVCRIAVQRLLECVWKKRRVTAGLLLRCVRAVNTLDLSVTNLGEGYHTVSSEPYFYETAYTTCTHTGAIPVDVNGWCCMATEIGDRDKKSMRPKKWRCTEECKLPGNNEIGAILVAKAWFHEPIPKLRRLLDTMDEGCVHGHYLSHNHLEVGDDLSTEEQELCQQLRGHPIPCASGACSSLLRMLAAAAVHYPKLRRFLLLLYCAKKYHQQILDIDLALGAADFNLLAAAAGIGDFAEFFQSDVEQDDSQAVASFMQPGMPGLEAKLQLEHATVITQFEEEVHDDPEYACCSCERLHQRKAVTSMKNSANKFSSPMWQQLKQHILQQDKDAKIDSLFVCQYCRPCLNSNSMPSRCILNGLVTEPVPGELAHLDALSKQLIQRAKAFQTVVRLGSITAKVPIYNSLQACKGTMFFLPLPLKQTLETLQEVQKPDTSAPHVATRQSKLPKPELYIIVNGKPKSGKVVWQTLVNVNAIKAAVHKLKEINWLYKDCDASCIDEAAKQVIETGDNSTTPMLVKASKEDVAGFQAYTIRTMNEKCSTMSDIEQYKLLSVKEDALDNRQKFLDVMCFPHLFPSGAFGQFHPRQVKLTASEYAKSRLLNKNSRFRKEAPYVFFLLWQKELRELSAGIYNLMKKNSKQAIPVNAFLDKVSHSDDMVEANISTIFQSIRGSKQYWFLRSSELRCMVREFGPPTLFLTFSCAEYESADIDSYLRKVNDVPDRYPIGKLCCEDPISVSRKFSLKFHAFFKTVILKGNVLGHVTHYFFKKEYQARGAPHYHVVVWIQGAPVIGESPEGVVLKWINERICCHIPEEKSNPELHRLVTRYQMHKCSRYCKRTKKYGGTYITKCKFGFPREATDKAALNNVDDCLKSKAKIYCLPRTSEETRVNDYNPLLLMLWKANMDIQFVSESSLALAHYVTGYVTKAERSNMQELWQEIGSNQTVYSKLWSFGVRSLRSRECGLYEASDILLGDQLCGKSDTIKWVDAAFPHKRRRRLKDYSQLQELKASSPDSTDIFEDNLIDTFYPKRPSELDDVCLYDFVKDYTRDPQQGRCGYRQLTKPCIPNHKLFDPSNESQKEDYYYSLLLLFVPFRDESDLLRPNETAEQSFARQYTSGSYMHKHHERLQQMLQAQTKIQEINEARQANTDASVQTEQIDEPNVVGEAKAAMNDVQEMQASCVDDLKLDRRIAMLNNDQERIFKRVSDHLKHQHRHENGLCECTQFQPLHMFLSGVGGTGKSFLIQAIKEQVAEIWEPNAKDSLTCAVAAPTGLAAFNVGGVTIHRLFQLPIEHEGQTAGYWSLPKASQKIMRTTFQHVKLFIFDEVSMLSSLNLAYLHLRLEEVFGTDNWFGSVNILFVGDLLQLPPVNGAPVFAGLTNKAVITRLGCMTSVNIWKETIVYDELTINERQKTDMQFCQMLQEVRQGCVSAETIDTLKSRVISTTMSGKYQELQEAAQSPVCLFPTKRACAEFNNDMLSKLQTKPTELCCTDVVDETVGKYKWTKKAASALDRLNKDCNLTAGLEAILRIAVGARVMLRRNIDTASGLVNGAIGTVVDIKAHTIEVKFDHVKDVVNVKKVKSRFLVMKRLYVSREQFPLILAYAITIHKCQGISLNCALIDLSDEIFSPGMAYVALSRVRALEGLHLTAFTPKSIMVSTQSLQEINRLRSLYKPDLPPYAVPNQQGCYSKQKRMLTGTCTISSTPEQCKGSQKCAQTGQLSSISNSTSLPVPQSVTHTVVQGTRQQFSRNDFRFNPVDADWQRQTCHKLGLEYQRPNRFARGGPNTALTWPNFQTVRRITGDGNCLFRSFSLIITGSQDHHLAVRVAILEHMQTIGHLLLGAHVAQTSIDSYCQDTSMHMDGTWGSEIEILSLAHLLQTNIYSFDTSSDCWLLFAPNQLEPTLQLDFTAKSLYIMHHPSHFDVVSSVVRSAD